MGRGKQNAIKSLALYYMFAWGFLTAFARIIGHYMNSSWHELCLFWLPACLIRLPHGFLAYILCALAFSRSHLDYCVSVLQVY